MVARRTIGIELGIVRIALDRLGVMLDGIWVVALLEVLVAFGLLLVRLGRVDVGLELCLLDDLLHLGQLGSRLRRSMFGERLLIGLTRTWPVTQLVVGVAHASVRLGNQLEVGTILAAHLDRLLTLLGALFILALLKVNGRLVVEESHVGWIEFDCLVIASQRVLELLLLVQLIALVLLGGSLKINIVKTKR